MKTQNQTFGETNYFIPNYRHLLIIMKQTIFLVMLCFSKVPLIDTRVVETQVQENVVLKEAIQVFQEDTRKLQKADCPTSSYHNETTGLCELCHASCLTCGVVADNLRVDRKAIV